MPFALNINNLEALDLPALEELKMVAATKEGLLIIIGIAQMFFLMNVNAITATSAAITKFNIVLNIDFLACSSLASSTSLTLSKTSLL
jgi:hypothetical protein